MAWNRLECGAIREGLDGVTERCRMGRHVGECHFVPIDKARKDEITRQAIAELAESEFGAKASGTAVHEELARLRAEVAHWRQQAENAAAWLRDAQEALRIMRADNAYLLAEKRELEADVVSLEARIARYQAE